MVRGGGPAPGPPLDPPLNQLTYIKGNMWNGLLSLKTLSLRNNNIGSLSYGAFSPLEVWVKLNLSYNEMTEIWSDMLDGLVSLMEIDLTGNGIHTVYQGAFANLPTLKSFSLADNTLETLNSEMFIPELFDADYDPDLMFDIRFNPLQCDSRMCWLKEAEARGLVFLMYRSTTRCGNPNTPWTEVRLDCTNVFLLFLTSPINTTFVMIYRNKRVALHSFFEISFCLSTTNAPERH